MKFDFKTFLLIGVVIVIWGIFLFISDNDSSDKKTTGDYLVVNSYNVWEYKSNNWSKLLLDSDLENLNMSYFDVYADNRFVGKYRYALKNGVSYYFNDDYSNIELDGELLAIPSDSDTSLIDYLYSDMDDENNDIVYNYLKKLNLNISNVSYTKYSLDSGSIYFVTNVVDGYNDDTFYVIFYRDGLSNRLIYKEKFVDEKFKYYNLAWVLKMKKDKKISVILKYECDRDVCYDMYQYIDGEYKLVIGSGE